MLNPTKSFWKTLFLKILFILVLCNPSSSWAMDPWKALGQGDQTAEAFLKESDAKKQSADTGSFVADTAPESNLPAIGLKERGHRAAPENPAAQLVLEDSKSRMVLDPTTDALFKTAQAISDKPLTTIGGEGTTLSEQTHTRRDEVLTCEEGGEDIEDTCQSYLAVTLKDDLGPETQDSFESEAPALYLLLRNNPHPHKHGRWHRRDISSATQEELKTFISKEKNIPLQHMISASPASLIRSFLLKPHKHHFDYHFVYRFTYLYRPLIKVPQLAWDNRCVVLEERADREECVYVSKICVKGPETRVIDGVSVQEPCWEYIHTYHCSSPSKDDCGPLRARGCVQTGSTCKTPLQNKCAVYTQTYQCKAQNRKVTTIAGGETAFCLDGNCRDQSYEANDELFSSLAQLSIFKELQGQFWDGKIFKGTDNRCSKQPFSFKDCCGSGKGWGVSTHLAKCMGSEKALGLKRSKGLCHFVGTYCKKKVPVLGCVKKISTYCCFGNKLLRVLHEQGRAQIGMGWGEPKGPLCRGYTIDELQRIDFSKLDLREAFEDLIKTYEPSKLQGVNQTLTERLEIIQKNMKPKTVKQPPQREEE